MPHDSWFLAIQSNTTLHTVVKGLWSWKDRIRCIKKGEIIWKHPNEPKDNRRACKCSKGKQRNRSERESMRWNWPAMDSLECEPTRGCRWHLEVKNDSFPKAKKEMGASVWQPHEAEFLPVTSMRLELDCPPGISNKCPGSTDTRFLNHKTIGQQIGVV